MNGIARGSSRPGGNRVLWVSSSLTTYGGIVTFILNMRETSLWTDWNVRHVSTHCDGSKIARCRIFAFGFYRFILELLFHRPNLVHLHTSERGSFVRKGSLLWVASMLRLPVILHMHGPEFHDYFLESGPVAQRLIRSTLERADVVVALGDRWAELLKEDAPSSRINVIRNAIRLEATVEPPVSSAEVQVVFLGQLCDRKGTFTLIEAWALMLAQPDVRPAKLVLAGWGELDRARSLVAAHGIGGSVEILGWLSAAEADELLSTSHVLVLPSLREGQPMSILEAMAKGMCVVSTFVGGIPEMIADGDGILVAPGDVVALAHALEHVVNDSDSRRLYGANARRRAEELFDLNVVARQWDHLYRALTS